MERRGDLQHHARAWRPFRCRASPPARPPALAPEITSWPPPLSLAIWQTEPLRGFRAGGFDVGLFQPDDRRHRALADRHRRLHGVAADAQQPRRIGDRERAGRGERRIFAERMAGDVGDLVLQRKAARLERPDRRQRHRHQRRLGVGGQRQRLLRPFPHQLGELFAERVVDLLEDRCAPRERRRPDPCPCRQPGCPAPER